jgi:hypothetical protein
MPSPTGERPCRNLLKTSRISLRGEEAMKSLPDSDTPLVIRTDFSNSQAWDDVRQRTAQPRGLFRASVTFVDDPAFANLARSDLRTLNHDRRHTFIFLADHVTMTHPDHPVLVVDLFEDSEIEFRAVPAEIPGIENNLSIGNMDPEEFAGAADDDGIFRGFK